MRTRSIPSPETLVARAQASTGLTDLGGDEWQEGLERLVDAVGVDVHDDRAAVERIEEHILRRLETRLRVEAWYADHGEEAGTPVGGPLFIVGMPRTATTATNYLLAVDPQFRYPRQWELDDPVPPAEPVADEIDDPRRPAAPARVDDVRHIATVDGPAEDWPIFTWCFHHSDQALPVPSYTRWWREADHAAALPYHERILRMLHAHRPPHRWLVKMPGHLFWLGELAKQYPEAKFVWTHREPVATLASTCSVVAESRQRRTPTWQPDADFGKFILEHWIVGMERALADRATIGEDRFLDVGQRDLEADAVGYAERIYDFAGLELTAEVRAAMAAFAAQNQRGARGAHVYSPEQYGLSASLIREAFRPYSQRFGEHCGSAT